MESLILKNNEMLITSHFSTLGSTP